ncbi:MAG: ATP-binding protein [Chloroflexi bacterium]|nr:ATP-binding protein [Chloroflexota bacterium]MCI0578664.1 ATP-binding protein [Chloroflexota bacterium]MCI0647237.1 ATP-binding protein [Chloroflexota bacterium]MCI0728963.1 ATP-binding protein [Chloroflexota bacterium]
MKLNERLLHLAETLVGLLASPIPSDQFQVLADRITEIIPCDYLAICLVMPQGDGYVVHSLYGLAGGAIPARPFSLGAGLAGQAMANQETILTADLARDPRGLPDLEGICGRLGLQAALAAPLHQEEKALGALFLAAKPPIIYGPEEARLAAMLAAGLSGALANSRVYQMLADDRSTLEAVLRSTRDGVLMVNPQGQVLMANPAVRDMLGLQEADLIGQTLPSVVDNEALTRLFSSRQPGMVEVPLRDGRITQANLAPINTSYGERVGWAAVLRDITVLKHLEEMKSDFVNTVSHDLKNPISSILLAADLLSRSGKLSQEQEKVRRRLVETAEYMGELVNDLLDLGRIEAGLDLGPAPVDLAALAFEVRDALEGQIAAKGHQVTVVAPDQVTVTGNTRRLKQVFLNLLGNAVKYTPAGGRITVALTLSGDDGPEGMQGQVVFVRVSDNGAGIPAADLPHIFDKFFRARNARDQGIKGTGLGLAIARSIVEAHDGRIWVESEEGKGSTFALYLPLGGA